MVKESFTYCYSHDPSTLEERRRNNSKAGKGNSQRELKALKAKLSALLDDVIAGRVDRGNAAVAANVSNALSRVYAVAFKAKEIEEIEGRLEQLETLLDDKKETSRWG